jgi:protein SCO1/2
MQMSKRIVILMLAFLLVGCNKTEQLQRYQLEGVVVSVEANVREITVNHKAIPGFMAAMTMPYVVKDEEALEKLKPGDEIKADLVVNRESSRVWLEHVQITRSAGSSDAKLPSPAEASLPTLGN